MPPTGTVVWYNPRLGYGYIAADGQDVAESLFVYHAAVVDKAPLIAGERVVYRLGAGPHGPLATAVRRVPEEAGQQPS